ncbi:putative acyl-coenzyme A synthetase [Penicillium rolfsii]|nr:putative acyl-coenzyme A synthetase [Penicillium rolfsii]
MIFEPDRRVPLPEQDLLSYIFDEAKTYDPNEPIYVDTKDPTQTVSFNQARTIIRRLITGLRAAGVEVNDCVALHALNNLYYSLFVLAIIGTGGVFTGTNPSYRPGELEHHLKTSQAKFIITESDYADSVMTSAQQAGIRHDHIWVYNSNGNVMLPTGLQSWTTLLDDVESDWLRPIAPKRTTAARFFSSGTTGLPKAVEITHYNLLAQHCLVFEAHPRPYRMTFLIALPMFHAAIAPLVHIGALRSGYIMYIMRRFDPRLYLDLINQHTITDLIVVPPMLHVLVTSTHPSRDTALRKLKSVVCGAAPLSRAIQAKATRLLAPGVPLTQGWGMTESCCASMMFPYPECDETGSVGRLVPNIEAKLLDENGRDVSTSNTPGELYIRGPTITPGYFNNHVGNKFILDADGWLRTGDVAMYDANTRKWYIVDRKKDLIKVRGFQVSPSEIEAVLLTHPRVGDVAVTGVDSGDSEDDGSEKPRAYVVLAPGTGGVSDMELEQYVAENLARYKQLTGGVKFVKVIPRNASGKILRRKLLDGDGIEVDEQGRTVRTGAKL